MRRERLPNKLTVKEFKKYFSALKPGESFCYHRGNLGEDRVDNSNLEQVATCALELEITDAILSQEHNGAGTVYNIQKRHEKLREPEPTHKFVHLVISASPPARCKHQKRARRQGTRERRTHMNLTPNPTDT